MVHSLASSRAKERRGSSTIYNAIEFGRILRFPCGALDNFWVRLSVSGTGVAGAIRREGCEAKQKDERNERWGPELRWCAGNHHLRLTDW